MTMAVTNPHQGITLGQNTINTQINPFFQSIPTTVALNTSVRFLIEKVDNGFIMRAGREDGGVAKTKICTDINELRDSFVAILVEYQLEK
jgi:hypothetical protein